MELHAAQRGSATRNAGARSSARWFNPDAFEVPEFGTFGNAGRGLVHSEAVTTVDFSLFKRFGWGEGRWVEVRSEFFNLFNLPITARLISTILSPTLGRVANTIVPIAAGAVRPEDHILSCVRPAFRRADAAVSRMRPESNAVGYRSSSECARWRVGGLGRSLGNGHSAGCRRFRPVGPQVSLDVTTMVARPFVAGRLAMGLVAVAAVGAQTPQRDVLVAEAAALIQRGSWEEAVGILHGVVRESPEDADALLLLGSALSMVPRRAAAADALLRAIELRPGPCAESRDRGRCVRPASESARPQREFSSGRLPWIPPWAMPT